MLNDTTPETVAVEFRILRRLGPARRLAMALEMSDNTRAFVKAGVRDRHPDWDDRAVEREVIRLMIGDDDLFRKAYGEERLTWQ